MEERRKETRRDGDRKSISRIMAGSEERLDALHAIVDHLAPTESESAAKIAAAVAIAKLVHDEFVIAANTEGVIVYVNDPSFLGYAPEELTGQSMKTLVPEQYREAHSAGFKRYVETGERKLGRWTDLPFSALHKDGHEVHVTISFEDVTVMGHRMIVGVMRKVDESISDRVVEAVAEKVIEKIAISADIKPSSG